MNKIITYANADGLTRLSAVEQVQKGATMREVGTKFKVHSTTIGEWVKMYNDGGIERLNTYRKPRPKHDIDIMALAEAIGKAPDAYIPRLLRLMKVAKGASLKEVAREGGISVQNLMKDRRAYIAGKLPPTRQKLI